MTIKTDRFKLRHLQKTVLECSHKGYAYDFSYWKKNIEGFIFALRLQIFNRVCSVNQYIENELTLSLNLVSLSRQKESDHKNKEKITTSLITSTKVKDGHFNWLPGIFLLLALFVVVSLICSCPVYFSLGNLGIYLCTHFSSRVRKYRAKEVIPMSDSTTIPGCSLLNLSKN